jgi:hypothetical protein
MAVQTQIEVPTQSGSAAGFHGAHHLPLLGVQTVMRAERFAMCSENIAQVIEGSACLRDTSG